MTWDTIKTQGEPHYHTKGTQPIDLYRDIQPHPSLSALDVFSLCCIIKYATRMLTHGLNEKDLFDIGNYMKMDQNPLLQEKVREFIDNDRFEKKEFDNLFLYWKPDSGTSTVPDL